MYKNILLPVDGSEQSRGAVDAAIKLAKLTDGQITVLHVAPRLTTYYEGLIDITIDIDEKLEEEGKAILRPISDRLAQTGVAYKSRLESGDPAQIICDQAREGNTDLIVMGSRGIGAFKELFLGSVSHKVAQHATCPVLIVK